MEAATKFFSEFNASHTRELALSSFCANIGVRTMKQQEVFRSAVASGEAMKHLQAVDKALPGSTAPQGMLDVLRPVLSTVLLPEQRDALPNLLSWFKQQDGGETHLLGSVRIGSQIDLFPNSVKVRHDANAQKEINIGFKKKKNQRQLEKEAKASAFKLPDASPSFDFPPLTLTPSSSTTEKISAITSCLEGDVETVQHSATPDMKSLVAALAGKEGYFCKNLFLKAKKKRKDVPDDSCLWLVCCPNEAKVNYGALTKLLGYAPKAELRQGKAELLMSSMGLEAGHVTPFGLLNDKECSVNVVLDKTMMSKAENKMWFHPLTNEASVQVTAQQLATFISKTGRQPVLVDFEHES